MSAIKGRKAGTRKPAAKSASAGTAAAAAVGGRVTPKAGRITAVIPVVRTPGVHFATFGELSDAQRADAITRGLPSQFFDEAIGTLGVTRQALLDALAIASSTAARNKSLGRPFSRDDSDRLARLASLWAEVMIAYESVEGARAWMTGVIPSLGATPLSLLATHSGFERAQRSIQQLMYGVFS